MNAHEQRIANAGKFSAQANRVFLSEGRELMAYTDPAEVQKAMLSMIQLHFRDEIANTEPSVEGYLLIQKKAFLVLVDRGAINFAGALSSLAQNVIDSWRRETGIGLADLPAPPAPAKTPKEALEDRVIADFTNLSGDQFKAKLNGDRAYRDCYRKLAETNRIAVGKFSATDLDAQVIQDFKTLGTREFRRKMHDNPAYAEAYRRLSETNAIQL